MPERPAQFDHCPECRKIVGDFHGWFGPQEQQQREIEESQANLRASIAETERLVGESEKMVTRHREEREADDARDVDGD